MSMEWRAQSTSLPWSNPLAWWWSLLTLVSGVNIAVWFVLYHRLHEQPAGGPGSTSGIEIMLLLCAGYVFGCAFRSLLPRADVQRIWNAKLMKSERIELLFALTAADQPVLGKPCIDDVDVDAVWQFHKGQATGCYAFRESEFIVNYWHVQPLRQVVYQLLIIDIGEIKLKQ